MTGRVVLGARRLHLCAWGRVQGVFFHASTRRKALELGLSGQVWNREDGGVEAVVEGRGEEVEAFLAFFHRGPENARVDRVELDESAPTGEFEGFMSFVEQKSGVRGGKIRVGSLILAPLLLVGIASTTGCFSDRDALPVDERAVGSDYQEATAAGWRTVLMVSALASESCGWTPTLWDTASGGGPTSGDDDTASDDDSAVSLQADGETAEEAADLIFSDVLLGSLGVLLAPTFSQPDETYKWQARFDQWTFLGEDAAYGTVEVDVIFRDEDGDAVAPVYEDGGNDAITSMDVTVDADLTGDTGAAFQLSGTLNMSDLSHCPELSPQAAGLLTWTAVGLRDSHTFSVNGEDDDLGVGPIRWNLPHGNLPPAQGDPDALMRAFVTTWPDQGEIIDQGPGAVYKYSQAVCNDFSEQEGPVLVVETTVDEVDYTIDVNTWEPNLDLLISPE